MGTISKVGLKIWSFLDFFGAFWASRTPQNFLKKNKIVCNIKVDVWEEKCDISLKDRSISLKALIFFTPWLELFPVAWTMAYTGSNLTHDIQDGKAEPYSNHTTVYLYCGAQLLSTPNRFQDSGVGL